MVSWIFLPFSLESVLTSDQQEPGAGLSKDLIQIKITGLKKDGPSLESPKSISQLRLASQDKSQVKSRVEAESGDQRSPRVETNKS